MMALARRALDHFNAQSTDQADATLTIPIEAYIDEARYQEERRTLFGKLPLALALSIELPNPGDFKAMSVLETPIIISRQADGSVRTFLNACRHRGAKLCEEGRDHTRVFACPYHAWTYDLSGALIGRYAADTFGDINTEEFSLTQLPCAERCGLIWVSLDQNANLEQEDQGEKSIDRWLGNFAQELNTLDLANWHIFEQRQIPGPGWKVTMDGYLEAYHHNLVHGSTVGKLTVGNLLVLDTYGPHQRLTFGRKSLGQLNQEIEAKWQPEQHIRLIHSGFPNLSISGILGDHCLVSQIFPGPNSATTVTTQTVLVAKEPTSAEARATSQAFSDMVLQAVRDEDYPIGFGIQKGLLSGANKSFTFGKNEPAVQNYHRSIASLSEQLKMESSDT